MRYTRAPRWLIVTTLLLILTHGSIPVAHSGTVTVAPLTGISAPSPFAGCTIGEPGILFENAEVEPWVEVNPTDPNNIIAVWQQDRWSNGAARGLVTGVSHDAGQTWTRTFAHFSQCSGGPAANAGGYTRATDPWVTFAPNGDAYQISLSLSPFENYATAILVSKSTDGGDTWSEPVTLIRDSDPRFFNDKESITADPTDPRYVYAVWTRYDLPAGAVIMPEHVVGYGYKGLATFSRSTDGGQTWEPARILYDPGGNNEAGASQIVVLADGALVNVFTEFLNFRNSDQGLQFDANLALIRSTNKGAKWGQPIRVAKELAQGALNPDTSQHIRSGGFTPDVAIDRNNGALYVVWQDRRFRGVDEVAFTMSTDGGRTWSPPIRVNQTPANANPLNQQAFIPSVQVAADGTLAVTYYDFRNNTADPGVPTDYWIVHCHPSTLDCAQATSWGDEARQSGTSFDMEQAPTARGSFVGDYQALTNLGNNFLPIFVQVNDGNPANRTDVFFTTVGGP